MVGTARRRGPTPCGDAAPISERRRLRGLKSGAPTARRPYQLTRRVLPHHGAKRLRSPMVGTARRRGPTPCGEAAPHLEVNEELRLPLKSLLIPLSL